MLNLSELPAPCPHVLNNLAVGPDGALYAPFSHVGVGRGIVKIDPGARKCIPISQSPLDGKPAIGRGPDNATLSAVLFHQGALYASDFIKQALFKVEPANGDRATVSSSSGSAAVGSGPKALGTGWMTAEGNTLLGQRRRRRERREFASPGRRGGQPRDRGTQAFPER